jgi:hypothetical protein
MNMTAIYRREGSFGHIHFKFSPIHAAYSGAVLPEFFRGVGALDGAGLKRFGYGSEGNRQRDKRDASDYRRLIGTVGRSEIPL